MRTLHVSCCVGGDWFPQRKPVRSFFLQACISFMLRDCMFCLCTMFHAHAHMCAHVLAMQNVRCMLAGGRLIGMRHLRRAQDAQRLCADDGAFRRLSILKKYLVNLARAGGLCHGTCLRRECHFFTSISKLRIWCCARYACVGSCAVCSGAGPSQGPCIGAFRTDAHSTACLFGGRVGPLWLRWRPPPHWPIRGHPP